MSSTTKKPTHWTQCLPEAGKQIDMQVGYINGKQAEIINLLTIIDRLDTERAHAETKLVEEVDQHFTEKEIYEAKTDFAALMKEKEVQGV